MMISVTDWINHNTKLCSKSSEGSLSDVDLSGQSGIGYDLTIKGIDVRQGGASLHQIDSKYVLKPGNCVVLETAEHVATGNKVFGFICSRASLAAKGLIVSNLKVDPNYSDTLYITVFNSGIHNIPIAVGDPFCTIVFAATENESEGEVRRPDALGIKSGFVDKLKKSAPYVLTYIGSVATAILAIWTILQSSTVGGSTP